MQHWTYEILKTWLHVALLACVLYVGWVIVCLVGEWWEGR